MNEPSTVTGGVATASGQAAGVEAEPEVQVFHRVNRLKIKAGASADGPAGHLDPARVSAASHAIAKSVGSYLEESNRQVAELEAMVSALDTEADLGRQRALLRTITHTANQVQSLGTTYGFPLATRFATSLRDFTGPMDHASPARCKIARAHVDALKAVFRGQIAGTGGKIGTALVQILEQAISMHGERGA
jgi:hypothetical protein